PYKGFFNRKKAEAEGAVLEGRGYDTYLRPAAAFSTLGWFADPLLRHQLRFDENFLVNLIFHEVYHNTFYVRSETAFNESLATFVGHRAAIAYFAARPQSGVARAGEGRAPDGDAALLDEAQREWEETLRFASFLDGLGGRLRAAYAAAPDEQAAVAAREPIFDAARREFQALGLGKTAFTRFASETLNNAVILHYLIYSTDLDVFEKIFQREGDLRAAVAFIQRAAHEDEHHPFEAVRRAFAALPQLAATEVEQRAAL